MPKLLVPVDGSRDSLASVEAAARRARQQSLELHLLNVQPHLNRHIARFVPGAAVRAEQESRAGSVLDSARERALAAGVPAHTAVRVGSLPETIAAYARENGIDEIVVAVARKTLLGRLFTGSVVNELIAASPVPVTVVAGRQPSALQRFGLPAGVGVSLAALVMAID